MNKYIFSLLIFLFALGCNKVEHKKLKPVINLAHLNSLYEEITINDEDMAVIHIYSEYPEYKWVSVELEGAACIDDVARAIKVYLEDYNLRKEESSIVRAKKLLNFIFHMQTEEGYFYNFIRDNHSINKVYETSVPGPNFWAWRALWCLTEAHEFFVNRDKEFAGKIYSVFRKGMEKVLSDFSYSEKYKSVKGFKTPAWLPAESATDQAALLCLSLIYHNKISGSKESKVLLRRLCDGIIKMQNQDPKSEYYGAIRSWRNIWHAWGNIQSYALLESYKLLKDEALLNPALLEINNFYYYLLEQKYFNEFEFEIVEDQLNSTVQKQYAQIAYGIRPMVYAAVTAYEITGDKKYAALAEKYCKWFYGDNPANAIMYDENTGRCLDGIVSAKRINKNSGAESTIEALLSLIEISKLKLQ